MKSKTILKMFVDMLMTVSLLFLMAYSLVGETTHEWIGIGMFVLFILHHALNYRWSKHLLKGNYSIFRSLQTILVMVILICMIGSMISGIVLSRHVFYFLPIYPGQSWARTLHLLCAYWGFVAMSLHLGFHWSMMLAMARKVFQIGSVSTWVLRALAILLAIYGIYAFAKRNIGEYLFLRSQFVFFDYGEALIAFLFDYLAIMGMFVFCGHYLAEFLKYCARKKNRI